MTALVWIALALAAVALAALVVAMAGPRLVRDAALDRAWTEFRAVAAEVGGLRVVRTDHDRPRLVGDPGGVSVEIDCENHVSRELGGLLGLRCRVPDAEGAPNAAIWVGEIEALRMQFGRPRPAGDGEGLFEVYTRIEPSASEWWQDPALHDALTSLPGAGLVLFEGQLTVLFDRLDAESVRTALRVPALVREGVRRVTLH